jgi:putative transposase
MQTFSLRVKLVVIVRGVLMVLEKRLIDRKLLFFDELGEPTKLSEKEFYEAYEKREIEISADQPYLGKVPYVRNVPPDISCFPKKHGDEALRRRKYLDDLTKRGKYKLPGDEDMIKKLRDIAKKIGDACAPSVSTIRRWAAKYIGQNVVKLIPQHAKKGRAAAIQGELEVILEGVINKTYLQDTIPAVSVVVSEFEDQIKERNKSRLPSDQLKIPSGMTVRRYIAKLDPYLVDKERLGKHAADKKHRVAAGVLRVHEILERWEIDHTLLDVQLVDETSGLCIGRPYLTIVLDRFSRMVMGYLLHLSAPNTETVLRVIERSIRPKAELLKRFPKVRNEWWARGLPARIVPDNAAEFHAAISSWDSTSWVSRSCIPLQGPLKGKVPSNAFSAHRTWAYPQPPGYHLLEYPAAWRLRLGEECMFHAPSIGGGGSEMDRRWLPPDSSSGAGQQNTGSSLGD